MIRLEGVSLTYADAARPTLRDVDLEVAEGRLCLVSGRTGSGKTTLLRLVNGLVPHFTGGLLEGRVTVAGRDTRDHAPRELADVVGYVAQDPLHGFVTDSVEEELAYGMEQLGVAPAAMRQRVEETLDLLGIADLRDRPLRTLSAGQQQRVAIGSVLAAGPRVLVLDEPTSSLDPPAAEEVLAAILRLVHDLGLTVLLAEHRLERAVGYADQVVSVEADGRLVSGSPAERMARAELVPPVVELARFAGWEPLPLTVRDARTHAAALRERLGGAPIQPSVAPTDGAVLRAGRVTVTYGSTVAVREVSLDLRRGEIAVLMGRNGAGKSSLLWAMAGAGQMRSGTVSVAGERVGLVPQSGSDLLYLDTVDAECRRADRDADAPPGTTAALLSRIRPGLDSMANPRDLSEGGRLALVLAVQLAPSPAVVLLDEPTRGLDYPAKAALAGVLRELAGDGHAVLVSTHDVELAAELANRIVVMAAGEVVADGPAHEVLGASPAFAPQVAKILGPGWLTVADVRHALANSGERA